MVSDHFWRGGRGKKKMGNSGKGAPDVLYFSHLRGGRRKRGKKKKKGASGDVPCRYRASTREGKKVKKKKV